MNIRRLVEEAEERHREAMRSIVDDLGEVHFGETLRSSRRRFVRNLGLGGVIVVGGTALPMGVLAGLAAAQGTTTEPPELSSGDRTIVEFAQGLEFAAAAAYRLAVDSKLLDSQQANLCATFGRHHDEHGTALGQLAGQASDELDTTPNAAVVAAVAPQLQAAETPEAVLRVLYDVEEGAAATYLAALGQLEAVAAAGPAASILPVEAQHATALGTLLDLPPAEYLPAFQTQAAAFDPAEYAG